MISDNSKQCKPQAERTIFSAKEAAQALDVPFSEVVVFAYHVDFEGRPVLLDDDMERLLASILEERR